MKICYISCSSIFGGVENIIAKTLNALSDRYEVALIAPKNCQYKDKFNTKVKIFEYQSFDKRYNPFLYKEIANIAKNYDLIHTHGAKATQIFQIINKFLNKKFVATKHNTRKGNIFNKIKNVISVSKQTAKTIKNKSKVIYFGIEKSEVTPKKLSDTFSIVAIGRLDAIKGFDELIKRVAHLNFKFELFIVGDGKEKENLQNLINNLDLKEKVHIIGFRDDIRELLSGADMQIISSKSEGLPNVLLEGIFYSNLLISTNVGGISEILDSKFLFNYENLAQKIDEIYKNKQAWITNFKEFVNKKQKELSFENYLNNLISYYKDIK